MGHKRDAVDISLTCGWNSQDYLSTCQGVKISAKFSPAICSLISAIPRTVYRCAQERKNGSVVVVCCLRSTLGHLLGCDKSACHHHHGLQTGETGDCWELWILLVVDDDDEDEGRLVKAEHWDCCNVGMLILIMTGCWCGTAPCWGLTADFMSVPCCAGVCCRV